MWIIGLFGHHQCLTALATRIPPRFLVNLMWQPNPSNGRTIVHAVACGGHTPTFDVAVTMYISVQYLSYPSASNRMCLVFVGQVTQRVFS